MSFSIFDEPKQPTCLELNEDNLCVVPRDEWGEGLAMSLILGFYYMINAGLPITIYYTIKKSAIDAGIIAGTYNIWYQIAWFVMVYGHFIDLVLPFILWPFTYTKHPTILGFYAILTEWAGGFIAWLIYLTATVFLIVAAATLNSELIWYEAALYAVVEAGAFMFTVHEMPTAYELYYYTVPEPYPTTAVNDSSTDTTVEDFTEETTQDGATDANDAAT